MAISARNVWAGSISAIVDGRVNAEVELSLAGGQRLVAVVTESSVDALGLAVGKPAVAYVKAPWVMLLAGEGDVNFSARNRLAGVVDSVHKGAVNSEVSLRLPGGARVHAVVTHEAVMELGLKPGVAASALIKASDVVLGVPG